MTSAANTTVDPPPQGKSEQDVKIAIRASLIGFLNLGVTLLCGALYPNLDSLYRPIAFYFLASFAVHQTA